MEGWRRQYEDKHKEIQRRRRGGLRIKDYELISYRLGIYS